MNKKPIQSLDDFQRLTGVTIITTDEHVAFHYKDSVFLMEFHCEAYHENMHDLIPCDEHIINQLTFQQIYDLGIMDRKAYEQHHQAYLAERQQLIDQRDYERYLELKTKFEKT